ncbi:ATP synthase F1 subunit epsilon [Collinsella vaginalis]|uniref:ATP synthase F1 subunit epsilon n=1 Tax=Collinsella vaginalis TaxID=1870987 RepID=UPI0015C4F771|nr:ATP synthase F1 subunit epsilon [Collinsella vaginalis]
MAIDVRIVCPEHAAFAGEAAFLTVPSTDGSLGIGGRHASEIFTVEAGFVEICAERMNDVTDTFAVSTGFVQVADDRVIILAERAEDMSKVSASEVEERKRGFEDELGNLSANDARRSNLYNEIAWCKLLLTKAGAA